MKTTILTLLGGLLTAASLQAGAGPPATLEVVQPRVADQLRRVTLNQQELGGEIDRRRYSGRRDEPFQPRQQPGG